jgi:outer membrane protein assembly factor BamB
VIVWEQPLPGDGVGGIAADDQLVVVGCRSFDDLEDQFFGFDARSGEMLWQVAYPAEGRLDYGNSPRATPLITDDFVYLCGAFGHVTCVDRELGIELWQRNVAIDFGTPELEWGLAGSPILVDDKLILQPGGAQGSIVALDPLSGETLWATGTAPPGHSSLIVAAPGGRRQVVGYDKLTLGGWDVATGARLWTFAPPVNGDFNVPTPLLVDDSLFVTTENNGSRLYAFAKDGTLNPQPLASDRQLCPDSHTPVIAADRVFGVSEGMHCLNARTLEPIWRSTVPDVGDYASIIASDTRVLVLTIHSDLLLFDATADQPTLLSRLALTEDGQETLSHPACSQRKLYVRVGGRLLCLDLEATE